MDSDRKKLFVSTGLSF